MNFQEQLDKIVAWRADAPAEQKDKLDKLIKLGKSIEKLPAEAEQKVRANIKAIAEKLHAKEKKAVAEAKSLEQKAVQAVQKAEKKTKEAATKVVQAQTKKAAKASKPKGKQGPKHAGDTFFGRAKMIQLQKGVTWAEAKAEAKEFFAARKKEKAEAVKGPINAFKAQNPKDYSKATSGTQDVTRDASRPAKPFGKRPSRAGAKRKFYWENRSNRADVKQPPKTYPKLRRGGSVDDIGDVNAMPVMRRGGMLGSGRFAKYGMRVGSGLEKRLDEMMSKSKNYCDVMPSNCKPKQGISRNKMPQINDADTDAFVAYLKTQGIDRTSRKTRRVGDLKPTQSNISLERVKKMFERMDEGYYKNAKGQTVNPLKYKVLVTKDGHLLDGHHRWAASTILSERNEIPVIEFDTDIDTLLSAAQGFKKANFKMAKGGRPKSAHNRDHKYISDEEHEKKYAPNRKGGGRYKQDKFAEGGKVSRFDKLASKVAKQYEGKSVPSKYAEEYGKTYDANEAREVGNKVAAKVARKKMAGKVSRFYLAKKANGGTIELFRKGGNVAVRIVNEGEVWNNKRFEGVLGDYDNDGVPNADDIAPLNKRVKGRADDQSLAETVSKVVDLKNNLDETMYEFVDKLKTIAPQNGKVLARTKTPYSILKKLVEKRLMDKKKGLTDLVGTTIVTADKRQLDAVNKKVGSGMLGEVLDYEDMYSQPKGGYRAYHYIVEFNGTPVELQLKTSRQKALNELSHAPYKAGKLNAPLLKKWTDIANQADQGDKDAAEQIKRFLGQKNIEEVFYV